MSVMQHSAPLMFQATPHRSSLPLDEARSYDHIVHKLAEAAISSTPSRRPRLHPVTRLRNKVRVRQMGYRVAIGFLSIMHGLALWECLLMMTCQGCSKWISSSMQLIIPARSPRFFRAKIRKDGGKGPAEGEGELTLAERAACFKCGSPRVFFATTENDDEKRWREFVCKQCYIRLDLRFSEELYHRVLSKCRVCARKATFGQDGSGAKDAEFCAWHKRPEHRDVVSPRCKTEGCTKRPVFGPPGGKRSRSDATYCSMHRPSGFVDVMNAKCSHPGGCTKNRTYGYEGGRVECCAEHKKEGMLDLRHSRCRYPEGC
eukprot:CAMPEP_0177732850 /NCGR_PEP_ID=MMETSP0484_2-20121128/23348_1 /TAXON_ID=354590 /ORGANISM="Rhodomonas lens, Strain RHODO" /LENGTH=315 /DNA_ID=CAMNT_0019246145 /DNA_START=167 /DNA_END=1111 /DNA_ORIENTATION=+